MFLAVAAVFVSMPTATIVSVLVTLIGARFGHSVA
jgi:hypothetical protein